MHIPLYFNEKNTNRNHVIESKYGSLLQLQSHREGNLYITIDF